MRKKVICSILCIILLSISVMSFAVTEEELEEQKSELENNISEAENEISEIETEVDSVLSEIEELNEEIYSLEEEIDTLNSELETLNSEIEELEAKLEEEQEKYDAQYEALCTRIVAQYKYGSTTYLDVLLSSSSLSDFISKYYIVGKIAEYDTELLEKIEEQKTTIENSKTELEEKQAELTEKQASLKIQEVSLSNKKMNKNKYMSELTDEQRELEEQIEEYTEKMKEVDNQIAEIAKQKAAAATSSGYVYTGGQLTWPCPNYSRISSYFGYRSSSSTGGVGSTNHKGIDLAASNGSSVVAAEAGVVITVSNTCTHNYPKTYATRCSCGGGYGNYVMISHGDGLVTIYAHLASISVSVGSTVTAGQQIGTVGSTGYSTGYHLHFGVILNGTYVDPASYLGM